VLLMAVAGQRQERAWAHDGRAEEPVRRLHERENISESGVVDAGMSTRFWVKSLNFRQPTPS
jgi:hypothetical protein